MLEHETEQQTRMRDIIIIYAQESGDDGWVVLTMELKNAYNEGLPKKERIDTVTAFKLAFDLQEDLKHRCYVKHEYSMQLDGSYVHYFVLMASSAWNVSPPRIAALTPLSGAKSLQFSPLTAGKQNRSNFRKIKNQTAKSKCSFQTECK